VVGDLVHVPADADAAMMEAKCFELEAAARRGAPRLPTPTTSALPQGRAVMPMPLTLRLYGRARAPFPLAPLLLAVRLRRGKERSDRGVNDRANPPVPPRRGPLCWMHGPASAKP